MSSSVLSTFSSIDIPRFGLASFSFSLPLVAISLFSTGGASITLFSPPLFVSVIFLVTNIGKAMTVNGWSTGASMAVLFLIAVIGLASLLVNSVNEASVMIQTPGLLFQSAEINTETFARFARILYSLIIVGLMINLFLDYQSRTFELFGKYYIRGFMIGAFFGVWQFFAPLFGIPFWSPFGNEEWMISNQNAGFGLTRINGSASEPSNWVPYCILALALLFIHRNQFTKRKWILFVFVVAFNLVGSLSGTAAVALLFWVLGLAVVIIMKIGYRKIGLKGLLLFVVFIAGFGALSAYLISNTDVLAKQFGEGLVQKSAGEDASGFMRLYVFNITLDAFLDSPIFGVGLGTLVAYNTFITVLASGGVLLGIIYFVVLGGGLIRTTQMIVRKTTVENIGWFLLSWGLFGVTSITYGEIFSFFSWLWLFLCFNAPVIQRSMFFRRVNE